MAFKTITPQQAAEKLDTDKNAVYLDVRSQGEFAAGHAAGAINIPIAEQDPSTGGMAFNQEFLAVAEKILAKDVQIVVGCMSGKRSESACRVLDEAGYTTLANIYGGFGGARGPTGETLQAGWADSGLPVSTENGEGVSYISLRRKALGG